MRERKAKNGLHRIQTVTVNWIEGECLWISNNGVPMRLMVYDRRHGGDGYSPVDVSNITYHNLYRKIRLALQGNVMYQLREVA